MNSQPTISRREFFASLFAGALCTGTAIVAGLRSVERARPREHSGDGFQPARLTTTSDEVLAAMNDLTGILEP